MSWRNMTKKSSTKKSTATRYSDEERAVAKKMYMDYCSISEISRTTGINRNAIYNYVNNHGWSLEREMLKAELMDKVTSTRVKDFADMALASIEIVKRGLQDLAKREVPPTVAEAKKATEILEAIDRITRLDNGDPTDIVAEKPVSIKAIKAKIGTNPFKEITVEEIENVEQTNEEDSD